MANNVEEAQAVIQDFKSLTEEMEELAADIDIDMEQLTLGYQSKKPASLKVTMLQPLEIVAVRGEEKESNHPRPLRTVELIQDPSKYSREFLLLFQPVCKEKPSSDWDDTCPCSIKNASGTPRSP